MMRVGGFSQEIVVHLLLVIGFSGMIGSVIFTRYSSKYPTAILVVPVILLMACLLSLYFSSFNLYTAMMQGMIWGLAITIIGMVMQSKVIDVHPMQLTLPHLFIQEFIILVLAEEPLSAAKC